MITKGKPQSGTNGPQSTERPGLMTKDPTEQLKTHLNEVKHQGELKYQHSEPLVPGRPLHPTIY
jgi:hypothetical protein